MNDKKKNSVKNIILTSSIVAGSVIGLGVLNSNATETFRYYELGSGGEVRSELLNNSSSNIRAIDLSCGEDEKKADTTKESKTKDMKCGEGTCGGKATTDKTTESKSKDAKGGESKGIEKKGSKATEEGKSDKKIKKDKDGDGINGN